MIKKMLIHFKKGICIISFISVLIACNKMVEVESPASELINETVFQNNITATSAMISIYAQMEGNGIAFNFTNYTGLSSDEFTNYYTTSDNIDIYNASIASTNGNIQTMWNTFYSYIYQANSVIEGVTKSTSISVEVKRQLIGEASFVRAFSHFYLVNLFGDIPIITSTDFRQNANKKRIVKDSVYQQIIVDLKMAQNNLTESYVDAKNLVTSERVRPNKSAATALLARVYLYIHNWSGAESEATAVISQSSKYSLASLNNVFLKNSSEAIWQLMSIISGFNTFPGALYVTKSAPRDVAISPQLLGAFEFGDNRKSSWINPVVVLGQTYYYPFKYKVGQNAPSVTEYTMMLRLSELYLIRSEARAQQGNIQGSQADLNIIRGRAGLANTSAGNKVDLLDAISRERNVEFFTEFSDRWLDLKRTGRVDAVIGSTKGTRWQTTDKLYPIPNSEILNSPNLFQNPGY